MSSHDANPNSRLEQMQIRFQQKQRQDREQRKQEMAIKSSNAGDPSATAKTTGTGKVRQMFDERRRGAGIDRGNPLKPIISMANTYSKTSTTRSSGPTPSTRKQPETVTRSQVKSRRTITRTETLEKSITNHGNGLGSKQNARHNLNDLDYIGNETAPKGFSAISLVGDTKSDKIADSKNRAPSLTKSPNSIKLNPVVTKKSPSVTASRPPTQRHGNATPVSSANKKTTRAISEKSVTATVKSVPTRNTFGKIPSQKMASNVPSRSENAPPVGTAVCKYCGRHFIEERLAKHEQVCQRVSNVKRKVFDATKHRVQGTDAEKFIKKPAANTSRGLANPKLSVTYTSAAATSGMTIPPKKNNWRKKHEEFIAAIRAAKQVQSHLARGGKLSDLPPPPPSENPDYIQCPHCLRRFNEQAAERHIPKCATMIHNKPKPGAPGAKKK